jgi:hypothetical protein
MRSPLQSARICVCLYVSPLINFSMPEPILWNLLYISWHLSHLNVVLHKSLPSVIPTLRPLKFLRQNLNIAWTPVPIFVKLGILVRVYVIPHEAISTAYIMNPISNTNTGASQIVEVISLTLLERLNRSSWNMFLMPSEAISTVYAIYRSHQ